LEEARVRIFFCLSDIVDSIKATFQGELSVWSS